MSRHTGMLRSLHPGSTSEEGSVDMRESGEVQCPLQTKQNQASSVTPQPQTAFPQTLFSSSQDS